MAQNIIHANTTNESAKIKRTQSQKNHNILHSYLFGVMELKLSLVILFALSILYPQLVLANSTTDCAMKFEYHKIVSYKGDCIDGYINGKADVLYEKNDSDGKVTRLRSFGWFDNGNPTGKHIFLSGDVVLFIYYKPSGRLIYVAEDSKKRDLWSPELLWKLFEGEFDIEDDEFKDDKGRLLTTLKAKNLFHGLGKYGTEYSVTSVQTADIQNFLKSFSREDRFATTNRSLLEGPVRPDPNSLTKNNIVKTKDNCSFLVSARSSKDDATLAAENFEEREWSGVCLHGYAHGPGTTTYNYEDGNHKSIVNYEWVEMGSPIGHFTISIPNRWTGVNEISEGFIHPTIRHSYYIKSNLPDRQPETGKVIHFSFVKTDGSRSTLHTGSMYSFEKCGNKSKGCILKIQYLADRYYGPTKSASFQAFPCEKDCPEVWESLAGPMFNEMDSFISKNKPKVDEIKMLRPTYPSYGTTLETRLNKAKQAKEIAKQKGQRYMAVIAEQEEKIAKKVAESTRIENEANQAKKPVQSPNLDALIKKIPTKQAIKKKAKQKK